MSFRGACEESPPQMHVIPSERMRADALAQALVSRKWMNVLLLTGPSAQDAQRAATAQAAIRRYGLKLAGSKPFKLSGDPRERDLANPLLLTQKGSLFLTRPMLAHYTANRDELLALGQELFAVVESGKVRININQTFALADAADAHRALEARQTTGSTVLLP